MMRTRQLKTAPNVNNFSHWKVTVNIARSHSSISASESTVEPRLQLWYYIYINNHLLCLILNPCQIPISYLNEGWAATTLAEEAMETNCSFETEYWTRSFPTATVRLLIDYPGQAFFNKYQQKKKTDENDTKKTAKSQQSLSYYCHLSGKEINHLIMNAFRSSTSRRIYSSMSSAFCSVSALKAAVTNTYHQQIRRR